MIKTAKIRLLFYRVVLDFIDDVREEFRSYTFKSSWNDKTMRRFNELRRLIDEAEQELESES